MIAIIVVAAFYLTHRNETRNGPTEAHILDVPYVKEKPWFCSEASASMVLRYYGYNISQDDVHEESDKFENMLPTLAKFVDCRYESLDTKGLKSEIDEGDPVMLRILPNAYRHTIVVVGYDDGYLYVHDPAKGPCLKVKQGDLMDEWSRTGYMAITFN